VLLIDEAQEMHPAVLNELRLLTSLHFDSRTLLSIILAGNASLMTAVLMHTLAEHALGNYRVLTTKAAALLATAAQQERPQLDAQLYLEAFGTPAPAARKRA
jgi:general secretion pathway protein A